MSKTSLARLLKKSLELSLTSHKNIRYRGKTLKAPDLLGLLESLQGADQDLVSLARTTNDDFGSEGFLEEVYKALVDELAPEEVALDLDEFFISDVIPLPLSQLKLAFHCKDPSRSALYAKDGRVWSIGYRDSLEPRLKNLGKQLGPWLKANRIDCMAGYLPFEGLVVPPTDKRVLNLFNSWRCAPWAAGGWQIPEGQIPMDGLVDEFLDVFCGDDPVSREFNEKFTRCMITARPKCALILAGSPGVGKDIFVRDMLANLVGQDNFRIAPDSFGSSGFSAYKSQCRLFYLHERALDQKVRDLIKADVESRTSVEEKFKELGDMVEMHAAIVLSNNYADQMAIEYSDRKLWIPNLNKEPKIKEWGTPKIARLVALLGSIEGQRRLIQHLVNKYDERAIDAFPKTEAFKRAALNHYSAVFLHVLNAYNRSREGSISGSIANKGTRMPRDYKQMVSEMHHYENNFGVNLGTITEGMTPMKWEVRFPEYPVDKIII